MSNETITRASTPQAPAVEEPRTITYPLKTGGTLTSTCPSWCTTDHTDDVACGIHPADLQHQGDAIALDYNADGVNKSVLQARIGQYPFSGDPDEAAPYVELTPEGSTAASVYLFNRLQLHDEIRKVRAYLRELLELGDHLAQAQAEDYDRNMLDASRTWRVLGRADVQSLPIGWLLRVFGVTVVETEDTDRVALSGVPGAMELRVHPAIPQQLREDEGRRCLLDWFDARAEGGAL